MARPSKFTSDIAVSVCDRIAEGRSLRSVCLDEDMPAKSTVMRWLQDQPEFQDQYARAHEAQADLRAEEIIEIADDKGGDPQRDRLRVDARKWAASKLAPKKYGERTTLAGDPDNPLAVQVLSAEPMSADDWERHYGETGVGAATGAAKGSR